MILHTEESKENRFSASCPSPSPSSYLFPPTRIGSLKIIFFIRRLGWRLLLLSGIQIRRHLLLQTGRTHDDTRFSSLSWHRLEHFPSVLFILIQNCLHSVLFSPKEEKLEITKDHRWGRSFSPIFITMICFPIRKVANLLNTHFEVRYGSVGNLWRT